MKAPILDPSFVWIPSQSHDADSTLFRERQRARIAAADALRKANAKEATTKVRCITPTGRGKQ